MAYSSAGNTLYEAMRKNPGYRGILAPRSLKVRYMEEDIPCSLVPIASIGKMLNINTDTINSIIKLGSSLNDCDYWSDGRTVENLGISGMTVRDLRLFAIGETVK